jgi:hypothetical protein
LGVDEPVFDLVEHRQALVRYSKRCLSGNGGSCCCSFRRDDPDQTGALVGISQMHVSRLLTRALSRLRRQLTADGRC